MKNSIKQVLNIKTNLLADFGSQSILLNQNNKLDTIIQTRINDLKRVQDQVLLNSGQPKFRPKSVNKVINKLRTCVSSGSDEEWSVYEIRIISYNLWQLQSSEEIMRYAIKLFKDNWSNLYINGLTQFILDQWYTTFRECFEECRQLLVNMLTAYNGGMPKYQRLKKYKDMFDINGPDKLVAYLIHKNLEITEAPQILGFGTNYLSFGYFSDVIINYVKHSNASLDQIEALLQYHHLDRTNKLCLGYLIENADQQNNDMQQAKVRSFATKILNKDIMQKTTWAPFTCATTREIQYLEEIYQTLLAWINRRSIEFFFQKVCKDPQRREFWLRYVHSIRNFKIVGSYNVANLLKGDINFFEIRQRIFIETVSGYSPTAALVLYIKNKVFVEFSDMGALYVYDTTNSKISNLTRKTTIGKIEDLKEPSMNHLIDKSYYYYEGRMLHKGEWANRLEAWLKNIMNVVSDYKRQFRPFSDISVGVKDQLSIIKYQSQKSAGNGSAQNYNRDNQKDGLFSQNVKQKNIPLKDSELPIIVRPTIGIFSKRFFNDRFCIVSTYDGYCIKSFASNQFIKFKDGNLETTGSIIIEERDHWGFCGIYYCKSKYFRAKYPPVLLGFVKEVGNAAIIKQGRHGKEYIVRG